MYSFLNYHQWISVSSAYNYYGDYKIKVRKISYTHTLPDY